MAEKDRITKALKELGAAWAVSSDKYVCADHNCCNVLEGDKPAYHIHPDASEPHQNYIKRFTSLAELRRYISARRRANAAKDDAEAFEIMQEFWAS